jgi:hypothetical protein
MIKEIEVRGFISKEQFELKLNEFSSKFGDYKKKRRLSIAFGDLDNKTHETKIRITDGKLEVTHKLGDFDSVERIELTTNMTSDAKSLLALSKTFESLSENFSNPFRSIILHDNYIFHDEDGNEIKLYRQYGKDEYFAFEVETQSSDLNLDEYCANLGLVIDYNYNAPKSINWILNDINYKLSDLSDQELIDLFNEYLNLVS